MGVFDLGIGGLVKGASSFMRPDKAYKKASRELDQPYQEAQAYLQPYARFGEAAHAPLAGAMDKLLNPAALQDEWKNSYNMSDAARFNQERAGTEGTWAANALGLGGSTPALQAIQAGTSRIGAEDQQRYIDQLMQKYLSGAQIAQGIYGGGLQAGGQLGQNAMQHGQNKAQLKYGEQAAPGQMFGNLIKIGATLGGAGLGLGGLGGLGGGAGAAMGGGANVGSMGHSLGGWSTYA